MKVAAVQMTSTRDVQANLREAGRLVADAAQQGAKLVVLAGKFLVSSAPRMPTASLRRARSATAPRSGSSPRRPSASACGSSAARFRFATPASARSSRSLLVGPDGRVAAHYDKIHLFDVDIPGRAQPSATASRRRRSPGTRVVAAKTPLARIGMTVCYDIRFPALFHRLSVLGTDIVVVPAAFTVPTGEVHWLPLLQARAIESLVYVVAAGQWGEHAGGRKTYGHSLILGPWGELLADLPAGPGVVCADLDIIRLEDLRQRFPTVQHRREL